jgi:hypothetical protein
MGNLLNRSKKPQGNTKIGKAVICPLCNRPFLATTTYNEVKTHHLFSLITTLVYVLSIVKKKEIKKLTPFLEIQKANLLRIKSHN